MGKLRADALTLALLLGDAGRARREDERHERKIWAEMRAERRRKAARMERRVKAAALRQLSVEERFMLHVDRSGGQLSCWPWLGTKKSIGYGLYRGANAHRAAWLLLRGPISPGMDCHHLCSRKDCVNVLHLELMVRAEHLRLHGKRGRKSVSS